MTAACGRVAARAGVTLDLRVADAQDLGAFADASFDIATCAFGLMFCADAPRAFAELRRVVRPGGRIAVAVWDVPANNPFFTTVFGALAFTRSTAGTRARIELPKSPRAISLT